IALEICSFGDSKDSSEITEEFFSGIFDFSEIALEVCSSEDSSGIVTFSSVFSSSSDCPNSS
ncbi:4875_t:CDS:1, partial [Funneliformis geosporum]